MVLTVRPPVEADLEALTALDAEYARLHRLEPVVTPGSLRFFGRTEHSFVAEEAGAAGSSSLGFVFAQAIWLGERPQVLVLRTASREGADPGVLRSLVKALVKSAYDSGVYDLLARAPATDQALQELLVEESFFHDDQVPFVRILGSRGVGAGHRAQHPVAAGARDD